MTLTPTFDPSSQQPLNELILTLWNRINHISIEQPVREIFEDIAAIFGDINQNFGYLYINVSQGDKIAVAWQKFQIEATDLDPSDDPDGNPVVRSVLTTNGLAQSKHQFDWMMAGGVRGSKVVLGPGRGVNKHHVIIDRDDVNMMMGKFEAVGDEMQIVAENVCRPYGMEGTELQFGEYRAQSGVITFWPSSISVDTWAYLWQDLPMVVIA